MTDNQVTNNAEQNRFEIHTADGRLAGFAEYVERDGVREFTHTVVDDEFEGQGIGSGLARAALDQTRADGLKVVATCPFIKGWIDKHPDHQDLLA
ncbi:GNAT family N-acetyltransferase [Nocardioides silvaticus]|uniref:GNAT family N-acetyltransferase n=1 Tax=Nocardioides silvaticus TaxID=2201891 RepID=A0A316TG75_9ACTN|nr:GNAT family N-acetyltransferase [Nocardioides silvaticus]PWN02179.1 GNAT family N-acetyltransferase [Nocardioides silvaticus]